MFMAPSYCVNCLQCFLSTCLVTWICSSVTLYTYAMLSFTPPASCKISAGVLMSVKYLF